MVMLTKTKQDKVKYKGTPFEKVLAMYEYEGESLGYSFAMDLEYYLSNGYVFASPHYFVMLRPIDSSVLESGRFDPFQRFAASKCDTWYVHMFSGNMRMAMSKLPYSLSMVGFARRNILRLYELRSFRKKLI